MAKINAGIVGVGSYLPPKILTNADLEKMVDTSNEWIITRTGIKERRIVEGDVATSDLAVEAAKKAIDAAQLEVRDIELILVATATPDMLFPSTACIVQDKLKAVNAAAMDVGAACSGFIYTLSIARAYITSGMYKNILVIGAETLSKITDWQDRGTCILLGDGAGAAVVQPVPEGKGIISVYLGADGSAGDLLKQPAGGSRLPATHETVDKRLHYMKMSGNELFKIAVKLMAGAAQRALAQCGLTCEDVACLIPHQANIRIINAAAKRLALPQEKIFLNIEKYGNVSAASTIIGLDDALCQKRIKPGDIVVLVAFGGGLTWGSCVMRW